jgi:hypothetical protein
MKWALLASVCLVSGLGAGFYLGRQSTRTTPFEGPAVDPPPPPQKSTVEITLRANVDGSDRFVFAGESLWNEHGQWQAPIDVFFNGEPWLDLTIAPAGWPEQARQLDLARASIVTRKGRDVISLESTADGFVLIFSDTQMGRAVYEVSIAIPRR